MAVGFRCAVSITNALPLPAKSPASVESISRVRALSSPMRTLAGGGSGQPPFRLRRTRLRLHCRPRSCGRIELHAPRRPGAMCSSTRERSTISRTRNGGNISGAPRRTTRPRSTERTNRRCSVPFYGEIGPFQDARVSRRKGREGSSAANTTDTHVCPLRLATPGRSRWTPSRVPVIVTDEISFGGRPQSPDLVPRGGELPGARGRGLTGPDRGGTLGPHPRCGSSAHGHTGIRIRRPHRRVGQPWLSPESPRCDHHRQRKDTGEHPVPFPYSERGMHVWGGGHISMTKL